MRRWSLFLLMLALSVVPAHARPFVAAGAGTAAPHFTLPARQGMVVSDSLHAKVMLVDFWASWCGPCRQSFPWLRALHEQYGAKGLAIVAINLDKDRAAADEFLASHPAPFRVAFDPAGKTADAFAVTAMPSTFLIAADGTILYAHAGFDARKTGPIANLIQEACAR